MNFPYGRKGLTAQEQRDVVKSEALVETAVIALLALALQRYVNDDTRVKPMQKAIGEQEIADAIAGVLRPLNRAIEHDGGKPVGSEYCRSFLQEAWEAAIQASPARMPFSPISAS